MRSYEALAALLGAAVGTGCGGSGAVQPASTLLDPTLMAASTAEEKAWIQLLEASEDEAVVASAELALGPTYYAASGHECRSVIPAGEAEHLACRYDGRWFFVPRVFPEDLQEGEP